MLFARLLNPVGCELRNRVQTWFYGATLALSPVRNTSLKFLEHGIKGQYTGYNAPDDNAYVERVIRTIKEEEIWSSDYDSLSEAGDAIADYASYYNQERLHSSLDYRTPNEVNEAHQSTLTAA